jgi:hypothetical protein
MSQAGRDRDRQRQEKRVRVLEEGHTEGTKTEEEKRMVMRKAAHQRERWLQG